MNKRNRKSFGRHPLQRVYRKLKKRRFERTVFPHLPTSLQSAAIFCYLRDYSNEEISFGTKVENLRNEFSISQSGLVSVYETPDPGSFGTDMRGRAQAGRLQHLSPVMSSRSGSRPLKGILFQRIAKGRGAKKILELGSHIGLSGCYFSSTPDCKTFITVEGSPQLAEVAKKNIVAIEPQADVEVINELFDVAIDRLQENHARSFDLAYLDGQHERQATKHYLHRLIPLMKDDGAVIFDDIYLTHDMNCAWNEIREDKVFRLTVDFPVCGVGLLGGDESKVHVDVSKYIGRPSIYHPSR